MQRKSFFKSLLGLIVAPKIISEIDWEVKEEVNRGIIWHIQNSATVVEYKTGSFSMNDFHKLVETLDAG